MTLKIGFFIEAFPTIGTDMSKRAFVLIIIFTTNVSNTYMLTQVSFVAKALAAVCTYMA